MTRARLLVPVVLTLALVGCAAKPAAERTPPPPLFEFTLTEKDFRAAPYNNMFDVVNALRATWLGAAVAVDGVLVGGSDALRGMRPVEVESIRYLRGARAQTLFRTTRVLMVTSKRPTPQKASDTPANGR